MSAATPHPMSTVPFHAGELDAQARAGVRLHGAPIRDRMPDQHRLFFAQLPFLLAGVADADGWPVATALTGPLGFASGPDAQTLHIATRRNPADPAAASLRPGALVGLLGIDLSTRRRNRVNGRILAADDNGLTIGVHQSFGNCPQYIQVRDVVPAPANARDESAAERLDGLDADARAWMAAADTFFVATSSGGRGGEADGVDMSHRGGPPGFVHLDGDVLTIPDYRGNRYFNTLGNLLLDPRAALLFVDWATGSVLHVQGLAEIIWDGEEVSRFARAERSEMM